MLAYLLICITALAASALTFFSGFGLGTILMPVFALYFPPQTAVALTAVVHFLNNLFKLGLVAKHTNRAVLWRFGLPSVFAALLGAWLLMQLSQLPELYAYQIGQKQYHVSSVKFIMALVIIIFCLFELIPALANKSFDVRYLPLGGLLSGFFGGLSGNQGALRSAFLMRAGLSKESFIATGVVVACLVDISRLSIYATSWQQQLNADNIQLMGAATLCAFFGAWLGNRLLKKVTITFFKYLVALALVMFALALALGLL